MALLTKSGNYAAVQWSDLSGSPPGAPDGQQGWRISVYTLNNPIHSNKYCSFRQQSLRLLAMLRLRDLFCFSMFSIHCLMTAKFSPAKPALAWSWSSPNAISNVQCSRWWVDHGNLPRSLSQNGTWTSQFIPLPSGKPTYHSCPPMGKQSRALRCYSFQKF